MQSSRAMRGDRGYSLKGSGRKYTRRQIRELCESLNEEEKKILYEKIQAKNFFEPGHEELANYALEILEGKPQDVRREMSSV